MCDPSSCIDDERVAPTTFGEMLLCSILLLTTCVGMAPPTKSCVCLCALVANNMHEIVDAWNAWVVDLLCVPVTNSIPVRLQLDFSITDKIIKAIIFVPICLLCKRAYAKRRPFIITLTNDCSVAAEVDFDC